MNNVLTPADLEITANAARKMNELFTQVEDDIAAIRVYAQPGGCSGVSFGMTFADKINDDDLCRDHEGRTQAAAEPVDHRVAAAAVNRNQHGTKKPACCGLFCCRSRHFFQQYLDQQGIEKSHHSTHADHRHYAGLIPEQRDRGETLRASCASARWLTVRLRGRPRNVSKRCIKIIVTKRTYLTLPNPVSALPAGGSSPATRQPCVTGPPGNRR